jgi:hypothetical protein
MFLHANPALLARNIAADPLRHERFLRRATTTRCAKERKKQSPFLTAKHYGQFAGLDSVGDGGWAILLAASTTLAKGTFVATLRSRVAPRTCIRVRLRVCIAVVHEPSALQH